MRAITVRASETGGASGMELGSIAGTLIDCSKEAGIMLKFLGSAMGIIFLIGLIVVIGLIALIF